MKKTINIGLTGSTGSLGKVVLKNFRLKKINTFKNDITNRKKVFEWIQKNNFDVIIHLAAVVPIKTVNKNRTKAKNVNFYGTKNIVDACVKSNISWFFFSSTSHVYSSSKNKISENFSTKPISFYGNTKLQAEKYIIKKLNKKKISYCIGRIFSTTNKDQKKGYLIPDLKKRISKSKKKLVLKNLNHFRDFISMTNISKVIFYLLNKRYKGIINIASGNPIHLKDIALTILKKHNKKNYEFIDNTTATSLVGNISKLKKITNLRINDSIKKLIF
ncbi:MAG: NAD-dependent dehydratase [Pelagibacterales bacterium MED-G41]|nr:MAG: NAD-dependent dehydratase [Pelagibacterales bacterium MED-G41]